MTASPALNAVAADPEVTISTCWSRTLSHACQDLGGLMVHVSDWARLLMIDQGASSPSETGATKREVSPRPRSGRRLRDRLSGERDRCGRLWGSLRADQRLAVGDRGGEQVDHELLDVARARDRDALYSDAHNVRRGLVAECPS